MKFETICAGILIYGLWLSFGFIIPIILLTGIGTKEMAIPVSVILMMFAHFLTAHFNKDE